MMISEITPSRIYLLPILALFVFSWTYSLSQIIKFPFALINQIVHITWSIICFNVKWFVYLAIPSLIPQYYFLWPWIIRRVPRLRASRFSVIGAFRGLEWRSSIGGADDQPTIYIESGAWRWGGLKGDGTGVFIYRIEDVTIRLRKNDLNQPTKHTHQSSSSSLPWIVRCPLNNVQTYLKRSRSRLTRSMTNPNGYFARSVIWITQVNIHYIPWLARIVSLEMKNCRVIFQDLDNMELVFDEFGLGAMINFQGEVESDQIVQVPTPSSSPNPAFEAFMRENPLCTSPIVERGRSNFSPPNSPPTSPNFSPTTSPPLSPTFGSLAPPDHPFMSPSPMSPMRGERSSSRLADARRRASVLGTSTRTTAAYIWSRGTGRLYGSLTATGYLVNPRVVQRKSANAPSSTSPSSVSPTHSTITPTSIRSIHTLLRSSTSYVLPTRSSIDYESLINLGGRTRASISLTFGPKRGLFGEDTLDAELELGELSSSVEAVEQLQEMAKRLTRRQEKRPSAVVRTVKAPWSARGWQRIGLRAFKSVDVNVRNFSIAHRLSSVFGPATQPFPTTFTSSTDEKYTVSLDLKSVQLTIAAADASNNDRARNAFGTNSAPESKIRGIGFEIKWEAISLDCLAPREKVDEKSQLLVVRNGSFDGFSSWRPAGWKREELLFSSDPNLALIVFRGEIGSINTAIDLQLLHELGAAWRITHPKRKNQEDGVASANMRKMYGLPPRSRVVFDIGHISAQLADRLSDNKTTLTFDSDGVHCGCFTGFTELSGRRRDKPTSRKAFEDEDKIREQRAKMSNLDYALPPVMLPRHVRRSENRPCATLSDDFSISLKGDAQMNIEPLRIKIKLSDDNFHDLANVGRIHGTVSGDVLGRHEVTDSKTETAFFDWTSLSSNFDMGIDEGINIELWKKEVIEALIVMGEAHQSSSPQNPRSSRSDDKKTFNRLPSGVSARFSLGTINLFIGHEDINPAMKGKHSPPVRGTWIQTSAIFEYALYRHQAQAFPWRHHLTAPQRAKLQLPEDITVQALAFATKYRSDGGTAALTSLVVEDFIVRPIYNGNTFVANGGTKRKMMFSPLQPAKHFDDTHCGASQILRTRLKTLRDKEFPYTEEELKHNKKRPSLESYIPKLEYPVPPLEVGIMEQAQRPWLRIRNSRVHLTVQQTRADSDTEFKITSRLDNVALLSNYPHLYSNLHAGLTVKKLMDAWKKSNKPADAPRREHNLSIGILIPNLTIHMAFPLKEQLYFYSSNVSINMPPSTGLSFSADQALVYVPSFTKLGDWEELGRIKRSSVSLSEPGMPLEINPKVEAIRVRIPYKYEMNSLVLDVSVTIKTLKLLFRNFFGYREFVVRHNSAAEAPKRIPKFRFEIGSVSLEAKDDPADTNLNLIWRAGYHEQAKRNALEDTFAKKTALLDNSNTSSEESLHVNGTRPDPKLTKRATVDLEDARDRLDRYISGVWIKRMRLAIHEQKRREAATLRPMHGCGPNIKLPINILPSSQTAPLFRFTLQNVDLTISDPGLNRTEIIDYMGKVSSPFDDGVEFSLMVPLKIEWTMSEAKCSLRDYPLPLLRVQPTDNVIPAFHMSTRFIIAEEYADDDSTAFIPVEVLPKGCGGSDYPAFTVEVAKTIMPVKMYGEPRFKIYSKKTTEFAWGMAYQFAIQDFAKVVETFGHAPRDPSPKLAFFDKMRLVCHLKPIVEFEGPVHLHLKGTFDPYSITGLGAGFALAWKGNTKFLINQPNEHRQVIQIVADELLVVIPDLTSLSDGAATGSPTRSEEAGTPGNELDESDSSMISRRYTKPCAKFVNGTRVGFGFAFERTCRPWNCQEGCGDTENHLHRKCRFFDFLPHQKVILRSAQALKKESDKLGRKVDSYEGFRSDFSHFSVSLISPTQHVPPTRPENEISEHVSSLHCAPKAMYHFLRWIKLFNHATWLPTREGGQYGSLYPGSKRKTKQESKPLATIKYHFNLAPLYVSHVYPQVTKELWAQGKSESLGIKVRAGRLLFDAHQRLQERVQFHEGYNTSKIVAHKTLYAADIVADDLTIKGLRAHFAERVRLDAQCRDKSPRASELPQELKVWFDLMDYIDADRKPLDEDPQIEIVDFGDCPHVYFCIRKKAKVIAANTNLQDKKGNDNLVGIETTKFGYEKTHHCYLDEAETRQQVEKRIVQKRIDELQARLECYPVSQTGEYQNDMAATQSGIKRLQRHLADIDREESQQLDKDNLSQHGAQGAAAKGAEKPFETTIEIHDPRLSYNTLNREIFWTYVYSVSDRRKEEYYTSHKYLRQYRKTFQERMRRLLPHPGDHSNSPDNDTVPKNMVGELVKSLTEQTPASLFRFIDLDNEDTAFKRANLGLPPECTVRPSMQILVYKPQIALRSDATENAIVLLAVQEASVKVFSAEDTNPVDSVTAAILTRNYAQMKEVQAFYPTTEALNRERSRHTTRGLDFVPLEIFLDEKSQATDYDRILLKSNLSGSFDKFNRIRIPQGVNWPMNAVNENGQPIEHLKIHQDLMTLITPQINLIATSKHYDALYTVVTDLLVYVDPDHSHRNQAVKDFSRQFDTADRDPNRFIVDIHTLQQTMRHLMELQRGYETNLERLEEAGKDELFKIRADLAEGYESLYTINALISNALAKDDARAALKNALKVDIRVRGVAWKMLKEDAVSSLAQIEIQNALFSYNMNRNGSNDVAVVLGNVLANNLDPNASYPEIVSSISKETMSATGKRKVKPPFAQLYWSSYPPIGGIPVFPKVDIAFADVRFKIEEKFGHQVVDYIFSDRIRRRKDKVKKQQTTNGHSITKTNNTESRSMTPTSSTFRGTAQTGPSTSTEDLQLPPSRGDLFPLSRSKSQVSLVSHTEPDPLSIRNNGDTLEMRLRAATNRYFGEIRLHQMTFVLTYTADDTRKHGTLSMPDCVDFKFKTPNLVYTGEYWVVEEIFEHVKKDLRTAAVSQWRDIISQLWGKTSLFKSRKTLTKVAAQSLPSPLRHITTHSSTVAAATAHKDEFQPINDIERVISGGHNHSHNHNNSRSRSSDIGSPQQALSPQVIIRDTIDNGNGNGNLMTSPSSISTLNTSSTKSEHDSENDEEKASVSGSSSKLKDFLGKLKAKHGNNKHDSNGNGNSNGRETDELARSKSRGGSIERMLHQSSTSLGLIHNRSKDRL
ncbi:uncharacterized protein IL334_004589 [Kwoniella shivajii]|uniref:Uncharacterized protein n=1 Tax=Kwoniella shivajii TaxID=564305 RepID=A0ABZ1D4R5_9TREE|nr:hypothetical protein IL334_004589 [Kwoniella shivajii]